MQSNNSTDSPYKINQAKRNSEQKEDLHNKPPQKIQVAEDTPKVSFQTNREKTPPKIQEELSDDPIEGDKKVDDGHTIEKSKEEPKKIIELTQKFVRRKLGDKAKESPTTNNNATINKVPKEENVSAFNTSPNGQSKNKNAQLSPGKSEAKETIIAQKTNETVSPSSKQQEKNKYESPTSLKIKDTLVAESPQESVKKQQSVYENLIESKTVELSKLIETQLKSIIKAEDMQLLCKNIILLFKGVQLKALTSTPLAKEKVLKKEESLEKIAAPPGEKKEKKGKKEKKVSGGKKKKTDKIKQQSEEEEFHDHVSVKLEDPTTELPKKLMAAMNQMSDDISQLGTDEYGEWLLDITKDSDLTRRIIQNGHLLSLLLRNLYKKKEKPDLDIRVFDSGTQTEKIFTAETLQNLIGSGKRLCGDKIVMDCPVQTNEKGAEPSKEIISLQAYKKGNHLYLTKLFHF